MAVWGETQQKAFTEKITQLYTYMIRDVPPEYQQMLQALEWEQS